MFKRVMPSIIGLALNASRAVYFAHYMLGSTTPTRAFLGTARSHNAQMCTAIFHTHVGLSTAAWAVCSGHQVKQAIAMPRAFCSGTASGSWIKWTEWTDRTGTWWVLGRIPAREEVPRGTREGRVGLPSPPHPAKCGYCRREINETCPRSCVLRW
jgi:hypothetical protein